MVLWKKKVYFALSKRVNNSWVLRSEKRMYRNRNDPQQILNGKRTRTVEQKSDRQNKEREHGGVRSKKRRRREWI